MLVRFTCDADDPRLEGWGTYGLADLLNVSPIDSGSVKVDGTWFVFVDVAMRYGDALAVYGADEALGMIVLDGEYSFVMPGTEPLPGLFDTEVV
jgi:hypothetical protein